MSLIMQHVVAGMAGSFSREETPHMKHFGMKDNLTPDSQHDQVYQWAS